MQYFSSEASADYFQITLHLYYSRIIGASVLEAHMSTLSALSESSDHLDYLIKNYISKVIIDEHWLEKPTAEREIPGTYISEPKIEVDEDIYLMAGPNLQWKFHLTDVDFFPSIPHGHFKNDKRKKLDAYLGWTYQDTRQTGRLKRKDIIDLWNNPKFREFAKDHINFYLDFAPHHVWRVPNPIKLPSKR